MEEKKTCPRCDGELAPDHLGEVCPRCLMEEGIEDPFTPGSGRFLPPPPEALAPAFPDLEILAFLGRGGMGAVYRVRHRKLGRELALKVVPLDATSDPTFPERFLREARALASLSHPGIVLVNDFGETGGWLYLLMEFVDGSSLRALLRGGPLDGRRAIEIAGALADALSYAHDRGIAHRDVKPENILFDEAGHVSLVDFGLVKLLTDREDLTLTETRQILGTPHYMAPEQVERPAEVDHRVDVYSLGVVLYEMLTGRLPLGRFAPPSEVTSVPEGLDEVVLRALAQDPAERHPHMRALREDLRNATDPRPADPVEVEDAIEAPVPGRGARKGESAGAASEDDEGRRAMLLAFAFAGIGTILTLFLPWLGFSVGGRTGYEDAFGVYLFGGIPAWFAMLPGLVLAMATIGELAGGWRVSGNVLIAIPLSGILLPLTGLVVTALGAGEGLPDGIGRAVKGPYPGIGVFLNLLVYILLTTFAVKLLTSGEPRRGRRPTSRFRRRRPRR